MLGLLGSTVIDMVHPDEQAMVHDLRAGSAPLRQRIPGLLAVMAEQGSLLQVGDEYRLQTREGSEWEADYRGRLRAILEKELEDLDRRATLAAPARPDLHEIDLSAVPEPSGVGPAEPERTTKESPVGAPVGSSSMFQRPSRSAEESDAGPPTEALVVLDDEMADSGPSGASARRRA